MRLDNPDGTPAAFPADASGLEWYAAALIKISSEGNVTFSGVDITREDPDAPSFLFICAGGDVSLDESTLDLGHGLLIILAGGSVRIDDTTIDMNGRDAEASLSPDGGTLIIVAVGRIEMGGETTLTAAGGVSFADDNGAGGVICLLIVSDGTKGSTISIGPRALLIAAGGSNTKDDFGRGGTGGIVKILNLDTLTRRGDINLFGRVLVPGGDSYGLFPGAGGLIQLLGDSVVVTNESGDVVLAIRGGFSSENDLGTSGGPAGSAVFMCEHSATIQSTTVLCNGGGGDQEGAPGGGAFVEAGEALAIDENCYVDCSGGWCVNGQGGPGGRSANPVAVRVNTEVGGFVFEAANAGDDFADLPPYFLVELLVPSNPEVAVSILVARDPDDPERLVVIDPSDAALEGLTQAEIQPRGGIDIAVHDEDCSDDCGDDDDDCETRIRGTYRVCGGGPFVGQGDLSRASMQGGSPGTCRMELDCDASVRAAIESNGGNSVGQNGGNAATADGKPNVRVSTGGSLAISGSAESRGGVDLSAEEAQGSAGKMVFEAVRRIVIPVPTVFDVSGSPTGGEIDLQTPDVDRGPGDDNLEVHPDESVLIISND